MLQNIENVAFCVFFKAKLNFLSLQLTEGEQLKMFFIWGAATSCHKLYGQSNPILIKIGKTIPKVLLFLNIISILMGNEFCHTHLFYK